jgi:hypothetical protein
MVQVRPAFSWMKDVALAAMVLAVAVPTFAQTDFAVTAGLACSTFIGPVVTNCSAAGTHTITEEAVPVYLAAALLFPGSPTISNARFSVTFPSNVEWVGFDTSITRTVPSCTGAFPGDLGGTVNCRLSNSSAGEDPYILTGATPLIFRRLFGKSAALEVTARNGAGTDPDLSNNTVILEMEAPDTVIPIVGHLAGNQGSVFRSDLKLYNRGTSAITGVLVFTPRGQPAGASDPRVPFTVAGKSVLFYEDVYVTGFPGGSGAARLTIELDDVDSASLLSVDSSTYTLVSNGGELGNTPTVLRTSAFVSEFRTPNRVAAPLGKDGERANLFVTTGPAGATVAWTYRDALGGDVREVTQDYGPDTTYQFSVASLIGVPPAPNASLEARITQGSAHAALSPVNNISNQGRWVDFR